jgi:glutaredoxin-like protein NrdH
MKTTVYSLPDCVQCKATKLYLEKQGVEYDEVMLTQDNDGWELATKILGYKSAPVVVIRDDSGTIMEHWEWFQSRKN